MIGIDMAYKISINMHSILLLYSSFALLFHMVDAEFGFLRIGSSSKAEPTDICASYNPAISVFPENLSSRSFAEWNKVVDRYPDLGCNASSKQNYSGDYVLIKRGNCTFVEKAENMLKGNAGGVIIVSGILDTPSFNANFSKKYGKNFTIALIKEEDYSWLSDLLDGLENVRITEHRPATPSSEFEYNVIFMWLIAVLTLACGAWMQGRQKLQSLTKLSRKNSTPIPSGSSETDNSATFGDIDLTATQVVIFFLVCSVSILILYFFYDKIVYIVIGIFCYATTLSMFDLLFNYFKQYSCFVRLRVPRNNLPFLKERPPVSGFVLFLACASFAITWAVLRKEPYAWFMQDILGAAFCIFMIKTLRLRSAKVSIIFLTLFFFYDIFYVFITPLLTPKGESVMVKVATGGGGPGEEKEQLPLLFKLPKFTAPPIAVCYGVTYQYSILGFGDIILPGLHVGFCAAWDQIVFFRKSMKHHVYFISSLIGYGIGLALAFLAVAVTELGQPALLYLSPCCILSTVLVAKRRNELRDIWAGKKQDSNIDTATILRSSDDVLI